MWRQGAPNELGAGLLDVLPRWLRRRYRHTPADLVFDASEDAILDYAAHPARFDPTRGVPLEGFLHRAAVRNLANLLEADKRRRNRETRWAAEQSSRSTTLRPSDAMHPDIDLRRLVLSIVDFGPEREALSKWLEGERRTAVLAAMLEISHLPKVDQIYEVKRFKDRMLKRLSRAVAKSGRRG